ncbi:MAG: flavin reductase family protein [Acidimicrobiales bacterium]
MVDGVRRTSAATRSPTDDYDRLRRRVLRAMPSGIYVLGTTSGSRMNLMTMNWATQVATEPKLVGISVANDALSHELLREGHVFALSMVDRQDRTIVRRFVKPVVDVVLDSTGRAGEMNGVDITIKTTGAPILDRAPYWLDCELRHQLNLGSHTWFVGEVVLAGTRETGACSPEADAALLRMEDTRMSYGG